MLCYRYCWLQQFRNLSESQFAAYDTVGGNS